MTKCTSCDAGLPQDAKRCGRCGTPVGLTPSIATVISATSPQGRPTAEPSVAKDKHAPKNPPLAPATGTPKWPWIIIALLIVIVVILLRRP